MLAALLSRWRRLKHSFSLIALCTSSFHHQVSFPSYLPSLLTPNTLRPPSEHMLPSLATCHLRLLLLPKASKVAKQQCALLLTSNSLGPFTRSQWEESRPIFRPRVAEYVMNP